MAEENNKSNNGLDIAAAQKQRAEFVQMLMKCLGLYVRRAKSSKEVVLIKQFCNQAIKHTSFLAKGQLPEVIIKMIKE